MGQLHKRFSAEQIKFLLQAYCQGRVNRAEVQEMLGIGKTRFFALLRDYRHDPQAFSLTYRRTTPAKLSPAVETEIARQLLREKKGISVSTTTITRRAKSLGCYIPHRRTKPHDREVLTASIGALVQHDASYHLWSPSAQEKWTLITSIDDFSRKLLFADFFPHETTWSHIQAAQALMQAYGIPLRYYVDSLRIFRFVQGRDSFPGLSVQDRLAQARPADRRS